jgi:hypothetical protein
MVVNNASVPRYRLYVNGSNCFAVAASTVVGFETGAGAWLAYVTSGCVLCTGSVSCGLSHRCLKQDFTDATVLDGIRRLPVQAWRYRDGIGQPGWHIGPTIDDMQRIFPWLTDGTNLQHVDALALRGVQEVDARVASLECRIANLECQLSAAQAAA